jgi:DNA-binding response OmpR family regulator
MIKILVVDDEEEIRDFIGEYLQFEFKVEHIDFAQDAFEAYHLTCLHEYDLICLDYHMPYFKGGDFLDVLRTKLGPNCNTPVIIVSAFIPELSKDLQISDILFYLEKPMDMTRMCRYVKMILSKNLANHSNNQASVNSAK